MTAINYSAITDAIVTQLQAGLLLQSPRPRVVAERALEPPDESVVNVKLVNDPALADQQALVAGTMTRRRLGFEIEAWRFAMSVHDAMALRDSLVGDIELALMNDRTLGGTVIYSWLEGGTFAKPPEPRNLGFIVSGTVNLAADVEART